eukprot:scaffold910_cov396-Prasinococcus_capsulatus_cf.AAC.50
MLTWVAWMRHAVGRASWTVAHLARTWAPLRRGTSRGSSSAWRPSGGGTSASPRGAGDGRPGRTCEHLSQQRTRIALFYSCHAAATRPMQKA